MTEADSFTKDVESQPAELLSNGQIEDTPPRTVAFPDEEIRLEEKTYAGGIRPKGVEMKKTLTQEEKDLAAAGYEDPKKTGKVDKETDLGQVDITEHATPLSEMNDTLHTAIDVKDPGNSPGLTSDEAKRRLLENGPNILTPPKKKSALRKVLAMNSSLLASHVSFSILIDC